MAACTCTARTSRKLLSSLLPSCGLTWSRLWVLGSPGSQTVASFFSAVVAKCRRQAVLCLPWVTCCQGHIPGETNSPRALQMHLVDVHRKVCPPQNSTGEKEKENQRVFLAVKLMRRKSNSWFCAILHAYALTWEFLSEGCNSPFPVLCSLWNIFCL